MRSYLISYSKQNGRVRPECLQVFGMLTSIPNDLLEANVSEVFDEILVHVEGKDIQMCHGLKDNERAIVKFSHWKYSLKKDLKSLDSTELGFLRSQEDL